MSWQVGDQEETTVQFQPEGQAELMFQFKSEGRKTTVSQFKGSQEERIVSCPEEGHTFWCIQAFNWLDEAYPH